MGTVTYMVVYKNVGFYHVENLRERFSVLSIHFYKVPIKIVVLCITSKAVFLRSVLVGPCG